MRRIAFRSCGCAPGRATAHAAYCLRGMRRSRLCSAALASAPTSAKATAPPRAAGSGSGGCGGGPIAARSRARCCRCGASIRMWPGARTRADRRYNRPFRRSANEPGDRLWRDDALYDLIIEIDHNTRPRVAGRGSAVFLHIARPNCLPTAGCVAFEGRDLWRVLERPRAKNENRDSLSRRVPRVRRARRRSRCRPARGWRQARSRSGNPRSCPSTAASRPWRAAIFAVSAKCGAGGFIGRGDAHQPGDLEPIGLPAAVDELVGLLAAARRPSAARRRC